jgi:anaerobic selenocysteine-containing dehydrogenase
MPAVPVSSAAHEGVLDTACPLDCPDACSLSVTVRDGKLVTIDGSHRNPDTGGYICAKVRRFGERVYGSDRLLFPGIRIGPKGAGRFARVSWDEAMEILEDRMSTIREEWGGEAILPFSYGGSNGLLTQDTTDALLFPRLGASRLARTVCAAPTGAAALAMYGKMATVAYQDFEHAQLVIVWGANPSASGIHLVPRIRAAKRRGARLVVVDPRATQLARQADVHLALRPGTDVVVALAIHRHLFEEGLADLAFLGGHATGVDELREKARPWTFERAAAIAGVPASDLEMVARLYARSSPALIRCGWGLERNRNGGNAVMAVLALPAVGGKFGLRGGGYTMSNSAAWNIKPTWVREEGPPTREVNMNHLGRALTEYDDPPVKMLFVYNCNPVVTMPDQNRVIRGLEREDLFTVVFDQVRTDSARYADLVLPATTFLEAYDIAKGYGSISLQLTRPVIEPEGEARTNTDVFGELIERLGLGRSDDNGNELEMLLRIFNELPVEVGDRLKSDELAVPPCGFAPVQFVDVFPKTDDGRIHLFPEALDREAPGGLYSYQADPATDRFPLALISPASSRTISSTLGELATATAQLVMHPGDAAPRGLAHEDLVTVFNDLGQVMCRLRVEETVRRGTVSLPKGLWRRSTLNGATATALAPDTLTDLGGGACFNDARVEVEKAGS